MADQSVHPEAARWGGWDWREPVRGEHFRRCSYCGGMHPEDLAAEQEWLRMSWADMKYGWPHKLYVDVPNRDPERLYVRSASNTAPSMGADRYVEWDELTDEQREVVRRDGWDGPDRVSRFFEFGTHPAHFGKFYTIHLGDAGLSPAVKALIEYRSGVRFVFADGKIGYLPLGGGDQSYG